MCAANLVTSMVRPPPMPATASYAPARSRLPSVTAASWLPSLDPEHLGGLDLEFRDDAVPLAGAHRHGHPALGGDPLVGQQRAQILDGPRPDVDDQRRGEHPGQERHVPCPRLAVTEDLLAVTSDLPGARCKSA